MDQAVYWLWFAGLFGRGTRLSHEMLEFYGSAEAVFEASEQELRQTALLTREQIARVLCHDTDAAQRQYDEALRGGLPGAHSRGRRISRLSAAYLCTAIRPVPAG